jgi:Methylase involved in ubiquinone/menaquinone biosynthesis
VWEQKYSAGHTQRYPWDQVVSFVLRHAPRDRPRRDVSILEVGCGTGSNLWFMAREGFTATGIDASPSAIAAAKARMEAESLSVSLHVGSFTALPFPDQNFDMVVDRCSLTCVGRSKACMALAEICRTLKPGGVLQFNPYSAAHGSLLTGNPAGDGLVTDIAGGTLTGCGQICFYSRQDALTVLGDGFVVEECRHLLLVDENLPPETVHAEWRIVARKKRG